MFTLRIWRKQKTKLTIYLITYSVAERPIVNVRPRLKKAWSSSRLLVLLAARFETSVK